ncbi:hypothetical protein CC86DRAFT_114385 [Ophiobolus disseminans]|uniref:Secreted protein n=1 Tax=Ophiobolus disseminans TaxID=1469910 RepID=A0A6A6ZIK1_9PLEO|nr:hypothetical protein CC86DRAFT_114385 [Ophiobolus disseminans]
MFSQHHFLAGLLLCARTWVALASGGSLLQNLGSCDHLLDAGLQDLVLLPDSDAYRYHGRAPRARIRLVHAEHQTTVTTLLLNTRHLNHYSSD